MEQHVSAILPATDLDAAQAFFERLGFALPPGGYPDYRIMRDVAGGEVHLAPALDGWLTPGRNPFGLYLFRRDVDALATAFAGEIIGGDGARATDWGMYEFAVNGPDDLLVRVGWPIRLFEAAETGNAA